MFVSKVRLFPLIYWFVHFTLTDKHGTKNLQGLIHPWMTNPSAPASPLELKECGCKGNCGSNRCKCKKFGHPRVTIR